jgi:hypothetical protein
LPSDHGILDDRLIRSATAISERNVYEPVVAAKSERKHRRIGGQQ